MEKVSVRFYNDHLVRAVWDDTANKWWFSVLDIIGAFNGQEDYEKNRNYWKYFKAKLRREHSELVSATTQLKMKAAMRASTTDARYIKSLLLPALTDDISSREMFMKGIDYSYYYEQVDQ